MLTCANCGTANTDDSSFCGDCGKPLRQGDTLGGLETDPIPDPRAGPLPSGAGLELEPGTLFADRYTIVEKIGQGGMGVVYRATETLGARTRDIALKLIRADRLADDKAVEKLVNEGVLTQDIRHPNVVAVYNVGVADGKPFVAMELVEGISLREWERRQMTAGQETSLATVLEVVGGLLDGLEAAHRIGVVHRDLKPENVILTGEPSAAEAPLKILDFGIARAPGTQDSRTGTGLGTPNYMAPEQITNPSAAGPPADLYSLSVIFYEMLMEVLPAGHWQPPSGGRSDVPQAIDKLIEQGLSNRPLNRPQSVSEYRSLLAEAVGGPPPPLGPEPVPVPEPDPLPGTKLDKRFVFGGLAGLGAIVLVASVLSQAHGGGSGGYLDPGDDNGALESTNDPGEAGPLPPQPSETAPYAPETGNHATASPPPISAAGAGVSGFSGQWVENDGSTYQIDVAPTGLFSGTGRWTDGQNVEVQGNLINGQFVLDRPGAARLGGVLVWDGGCHFGYRMFNQDGSVAAEGMMHVDHQPNQPCPARFGGG